jgi:2-isopropylmalate synthase
VGQNIVEASWEALSDGYLYGLLHADDTAPSKPPAGQLAAANG